MSRDALLYLEDILQSITAIEEYTQGITEVEFNATQIVQDAVVRRLEIIGEAAKQLPDEFKDHYPQVPWRRIAGMRNRIIHEYFGVILERVWAVAERDLQPLKLQISQIYQELSK
jgi:uncharacterized protein with HEPN domain